MANDWIRVRMDIHEDPAILQIAAKLDVRAETVVGYCVRFWSWASRHMSQEDRDICPAGSVAGIEMAHIEQVLNMPNFLQMLLEVGWLERNLIDNLIDNLTVLTIPKFDRWLSESAKQRGLEAERKRAQRAKEKVSHKNWDNVPPREEKRREEKKQKRRGVDNFPAGKSSPPPKGQEFVVALAEAWNSLGWVFSVRLPLAESNLKAARHGWKSPEVRELLKDPEAITTAIEDQRDFLEGQGWFRFSWLFKGDKSGERNLVKLMEHAYKGNGKADSNLKPSDILKDVDLEED